METRVDHIVEGATIEDALGINFLQSQLNTSFQETYPSESLSLTLIESSPVLIQIHKFLNQANKPTKEIETFIDKLKIKISNEFTPSQSSFSNKFPLLNTLVAKIKERLNCNT